MQFESRSLDDAPVAPAHLMPNGEEPIFESLNGGQRATDGWDWRTTHNRPSQRWSDPDTWWRAIDTAMSWVAVQVVEGLAIYGATTYPGYFGSLDRDSDAHDPEEGRPRGQLAGRMSQPQEDQTFLTTHRKPDDLARFGSIEPDSPSWSRWILSFVARRWAAMRREREIKRAISALEAMDDRTLRDAGICRCEIEHVVRHGSDRS